MLASSALSGKFADPTTTFPPALADAEPEPPAAAEVVFSGLLDDPQADTVSRAARPAASSPALLISDTDSPCWSDRPPWPVFGWCLIRRPTFRSSGRPPGPPWAQRACGPSRPVRSAPGTP